MGQREQLHDETSAKPVACEDCNWVGEERELMAVEHLSMRVSPGEVMPVGECPKCGTLAHYVEPKKRK